ncbi:MAG: RnfABCDGE type electron transport complex subunit A [Candidatus Hydrothermarchaeales archaeon]
MAELLDIFIRGMFTNNIVLVMFLGLCSFLGVSKRTKAALGMSAAVTSIMTLSTPITWVIFHYLLRPLKIEYLWIVLFILVIASFVQITEAIIKKQSPTLFNSLGIYLPLVASNCAILGVALLDISGGYDIVESTVFGFSGGLGYSMVLLIMTGIRERLDGADVPESLRGAPIAFIVAAILSMAFMHYFGVFVF